MELLLILGANSSGKSLYAESIASQHSANPVYIATMVPQNDENLRRIEKHKVQRILMVYISETSLQVIDSPGIRSKVSISQKRKT